MVLRAHTCSTRVRQPQCSHHPYVHNRRGVGWGRLMVVVVVETKFEEESKMRGGECGGGEVENFGFAVVFAILLPSFIIHSTSNHTIILQTDLTP